MAEWKSRGYVLDSDEEDDTGTSSESQEQSHDNKPSALDSGPVISDAEETTKHHLQSPSRDRPDESFEDLTVVEDTGKESESLGWNVLSSSQKTDELQADHHETAPNLLLQDSIGKDTAVPQHSLHESDAGTSSLSSPLTPPPSSPTSPSLPISNQTPLGNHHVAVIISSTCREQSGNQPAQQQIVQTSDLPNENPSGRIRNLRHRNPIQLHPYAIEHEKYRQVLQTRGLKPLRIAQGESQSTGALAEDSQAGTLTSDPENQDPSRTPSPSCPLSSLKSRSQSKLDRRPQDAFQNIYLEEDDLPDVDAILRRFPAQVAFNGHKKRKVMRSAPKQPRPTDPREQPLSPSNINNSQKNVMPDADPSVFDIQLSPLRSQSKSPSPNLMACRGFRIPRGISPVALPTPVASSEPKRGPVLIASTSPSERSPSTGTSSGNESEVSANEPAKRMNERLVGAQRKIRGVLPASWLKLDLQAQAKITKQKKRRSRSLSPEEDIIQQRGVARPVASRSKAHKASETPIQILDWSSDADSEEERRKAAPTGRPSHSTNKRRAASFSDVDRFSLPSDLWGVVMEDNRIDTMRPTASRQRKGRLSQGSKLKKRQTSLTEMQIKEPQTTLQETPSMSRSRPNERSRLFQTSDRPRRPKFRPPDLSLLDVPSPSSSVDGSRPLFIRIAQRTVRSRNDKGKSVPYRKYVCMDTEIETQEANEYLRSWREGALKPKIVTQGSEAAVVATSRAPLQPCAGNRNPGTVVDWKYSVASKPNMPTSARSRNLPVKTPRSRSIHIPLDRMINLWSRTRKPPNMGVLRQVQRTSDGKPARKGTVRAGHLLSSLRDPDQFRPATLESLQKNVDQERPRSSFRHRLDRTTQETAPKAAANPLLAKFLEDDNDLSGNAHLFRAEQINDPASGNPSTGVKRRRPRKREPQRRNIQDPRRPSAMGPIDADDVEFPLQESHTENTVEKSAPLTGLGPFGTTYTTSFDIAPLPTGSYFTARTFLGSGAFATSFISRDLDHARGFSMIQSGPSAFRWGSWNDNVSGQLGTLVDQSCEDLQQASDQDQDAFVSVISGTVHLLGQVIGYFSSNLSFYDAIDRISFLQRGRNLIACLVQELTGHPLWSEQTNVDTSGDVPESQSLCMRALQLCVVIATQLRRISKHDVVPHHVQAVFKDFLEQTAVHALEYAFAKHPAGFGQIRERLRQPGNCPVVFDERHFVVELLVVVSHTLAENHSLDTFWTGLRSSVVSPSLEAPNDARVLELCWERMLLVLPCLEIDRQGVLEVGRRYRTSCETWSTVKHLLEPTFKAYRSDTQRQSPTLNNYCRALLGRCFGLITTWGWRKCEPNIGVLFDFFARRSLFNLPNEEAHGSPQFLANLHEHPLLELAPEDRCFHVFLKIIGSGLYEMRKVYPDKKIGGTVWRLLPNHGRFLPKDQAISQLDLDALRNHHDLLCTLYWGSPQGFRPKLTVLQNLVDVENSHKEACHINIRSWLNLVKYQLTANEPSSSLESFVKWLTDLFTQIVRQHQLARTEAEEQVLLAESREGYVVNRSLLESTIRQNQRQVEAILCDLLSSMQVAMNVAPDLTAAKTLLIPDLVSIFSLFSTQSPQTNKVIIYSLEILLLFIAKALPDERATATSDNDDSQDYGDWSALVSDALPAMSPAQEVAGHLERYFQDPLRQLLSNCFGADSPPEDAFLTKVIETWVALGRVQVLGGMRSWVEFIGDYGHDSWTSLRNTEQTRKFSSYFLAALVDTDRAVFKEHKQHLLKAWAASLVERELLLKYQHRLTSSLLNADCADSLLANPPFWAVAGRFDITAAEFSERRLSVISNLLSNMRKSIGNAEDSEAIHIRANHKEILKVMMASMKNNYQELGHGSGVCGAYVDFVHRVIELLQQHTSSICPIDRFFTNSSSFPLPAHDPTYVVGQLMNYGLRLQDHRTPKQLAMFVQSISERAAVDGQQIYLVDQLSTAMGGRDVVGSSRLRSFLISVIFPAYVDIALSTSYGWIMAIPILQATRKVFSSIIADVNGANETRTDSILSTIAGFLGCLRHSMELLVDHPGYMEQPRTLKTIAAFFASITAVVPALDYICRILKRHCQANALMRFFGSFAIYVTQSLLGPIDMETPNMDPFEETGSTIRQYEDVQAFAIHELRETLNRNWICHDELYYVNRGQTRREIVVEIGLFEEEKASVLREIERFFNVLGRMTVLGGGAIL
ncbi:MAG: hypothetical protein LQ339_008175 [Xanthoria mediterranea]|nr:MAG: hypothetical protein LQ339_008175 [Xanthoria mediterranea]